MFEQAAASREGGRGTGGCYDDHAPSNYAKIALRTLDPSLSTPLLAPGPPLARSPVPSPRHRTSSTLHQDFSHSNLLFRSRRVADVSEDKRLAELCLSMNLFTSQRYLSLRRPMLEVSEP